MSPLHCEKLGDSLSSLYLFTDDDNSRFAIVSADGRVLPILGYSTTNGSDHATMPVHTKEWLEDYQIQHIVAHDAAASPYVAEQWITLLKNSDAVGTKYATEVLPLVATTWNQSPYYNDLCPYDSEGADAVLQAAWRQPQHR